ncbi:MULTISPECIES: serine protease [unclassified Microbulbifer]|uniref:S1C family serine protease n=1 Tax=unclassified Microbulbifer TaxID=2619833 RepID=UPI0027E51EC2|nr:MULTISPECIES: serine protease [unclassified Microbulbifer]
MRLLTLLFCCFTGFASAQSYEKLYSDYRESLYQIRLIEKSSNSKAAIGSGFQISADGLVATNYHVVAEAVRKPEKYRLQYLSVDGNRGELELLDIDVVNDLALLRQDKPGPEHINLSRHAPSHGTTIISLGNPLDLGMTLVPGTYNGIAAGSFYDRIHFSGSINPGMSGGPVIDAKGEVVGINVATAGNQISFLVPVDKLIALREHYQRQDGRPVDLQAATHRQLLDNQQKIIDSVLEAEWKLRPLGDAMVVGEILPSIQCWGNSEEDEDNPVKRIDKGCTGQDVIYLSENFNTGRVEYEFFWLEADDLLPSRFYSEYESQMSSFYPGNMAGEDDVTNFRCRQGFTSQERKVGKSKADNDRQPVRARTSYCVRRYQQFPDLYDVFFLSLTVDQKDRALVSHFTLSGFTETSATAFSEKFTSEIQWH